MPEKKKSFFRAWLDEAQHGTGKAVAHRDGQAVAPVSPSDAMGDEKDPYAYMLDWKLSPELRYCIHAGMDGSGWVLTEPRQNLLILGPPRSDKTAGVLIPAILTANGPVVAVSTKGDVFEATALARARLGRVWHYSPDGGATLPGATQLRWSPISAAALWDGAVMTADAMIKVTNAKSMTDGTFWASRAGALLAPVLHAAAIGNQPMRWVVRVVRAMDPGAIAECRKILEDAGAESPLEEFDGVERTDERQRGSIFATASTALDAYRLSGALATTEMPNFEPAAFALGQPDAPNSMRWSPDHLALYLAGVERNDKRAPVGIYDTVYITAGGDNQEVVAPLVVALLAQIRKAVYDLHRGDESNGFFEREPVLYALDELYGMAPLPDLPKMLADCGSQGLLIAACLQDLAQAKDKWEEAADSFLTVFGSIVVLRGIRNVETLENLSTLAGKEWINVKSTSDGRSFTRSRDNSSGDSYTINDTPTQVNKLEPSQISAGHPDDPRGSLLFRGQRYAWIYETPYFSSRPWPDLLVKSMRRWAEASPEGPRGLPVPKLDLSGDGAFLRAIGGDELVQEYHTRAQELRDGGERWRSGVAAIRGDALFALDPDLGADFLLGNEAIASLLLPAGGPHGAEQVAAAVTKLAGRAGTPDDAAEYPDTESGTWSVVPAWIVERGKYRCLLFTDDRITGIERADAERWKRMTDQLGGEPGFMVSIVCRQYHSDAVLGAAVLDQVVAETGGIVSDFAGNLSVH